MTEQPQSGRDEKGLTLSGRVILRILMEFGKTVAAAKQLGDDRDYELLQTPTVLLEIRSLLWIATEMAKRIGSLDAVDAYLQLHSEEDEKAIREGMAQTGRALMEEVLSQGGIPKCEKCGRIVCPICRECHICGEKSQTHDFAHTPFKTPGSGAPN